MFGDLISLSKLIIQFETPLNIFLEFCIILLTLFLAQSQLLTLPDLTKNPLLGERFGRGPRRL